MQTNNGRARQSYRCPRQAAPGAAPIILQTGLPVMAIGGFEGGDPTLDADKLAALVRDGAIRYFLTGGPGGRGRARAASASAAG